MERARPNLTQPEVPRAKHRYLHQPHPRSQKSTASSRTPQYYFLEYEDRRDLQTRCVCEGRFLRICIHFEGNTGHRAKLAWAFDVIDPLIAKRIHDHHR